MHTIYAAEKNSKDVVKLCLGSLQLQGKPGIIKSWQTDQKTKQTADVSGRNRVGAPDRVELHLKWNCFRKFFFFVCVCVLVI